jgi:hypothetical protein
MMRSWQAGETQVLPEDELEHVPARHYTTRPLTPEKEEGGTGIEHHGGAYYRVRIGGELVTDDDGETLTLRGKDAAREKLNELR